MIEKSAMRSFADWIAEHDADKITMRRNSEGKVLMTIQFTNKGDEIMPWPDQLHIGEDWNLTAGKEDHD